LTSDSFSRFPSPTSELVTRRVPNSRATSLRGPSDLRSMNVEKSACAAYPLNGARNVSRNFDLPFFPWR